ncbi:hypothetical protein P12x_000679 [Tundrisphaera lichenicola]|uniref:hypothetical protein n=1 Tax=Tundrisphaera lichenicola TaxID=2029860 RepID=UPI003EBF407A
MFQARFAMAAVVCTALTAHGADLTKGTPDLKSAGALAFGPHGLLFVGDSQGAAIFAIDTGDRTADSAGEAIKVEAINEKIAGLLGTDAREVMINDLAVNPLSGKAYLSVSRGRGPSAAPAIVRVDRAGQLSLVSTENVPFAKAELSNVPTAGAAAKKGASPRSQAITDLAYVDGRVFVAGLSNEKFSSRLISIPYPFASVSDGTSVEIYHGAHGRYETASPVRTFASYKINGEPYLMAAYTCTPLVKFPVAALKPGTHFKGATVAELGNRNNPLDMIVYQKDGKDYILLANSSRGMMKISTDGIAEAPSISDHITDTAGLPYKKVDELKGVVQLDAFDKDHALVVIQQEGGAMNLETIALP